MDDFEYKIDDLRRFLDMHYEEDWNMNVTIILSLWYNGLNSYHLFPQLEKCLKSLENPD